MAVVGVGRDGVMNWTAVVTVVATFAAAGGTPDVDLRPAYGLRRLPEQGKETSRRMKWSPSQLLYPRRLHLEASTVCQLRCPSCPTAAGKVRQALGAGFLKFHDFRRVVDENPRLARIELSNWGEVFLNPELGEMARYAYRRHIDLRAGGGANLNTAGEDLLEALVKYCFRAVTCAIDGASQETYSQYRRNGNFENVIQQIRTINRFKRQYRSPYPALHWQYVAFGHNEHEIGRARRMARDLDMTFGVKLSWEDLYSEAFSPIRDAELVRRESGLGVAGRREYRERYGRSYLNLCAALWTSPQINYDGRVLGCNVNYWGDYGNAFQEGLGACLTNEKMNGVREALMGRRTLAEDTPCARCRVYRERQENRDWVTPADLEDGYVPRRIYILLENKALGPRMKRQLSRLRGQVRPAWLHIRRGGK